MKKAFSKLFIILVAACFSNSIYAQKTTVTYEVSYQEASAKIMEPTASVMSLPLVCDLQVVGEKIKYVEADAFKDYVVTVDLLSNILNFKQIALCNAALAYNADIIIGASIIVNTNAAGKLEITISGYPAKYANFRPATQSDLNLISATKGVYHDRSAEILGRPTTQLKVEDTQTKKSGLSALLN